MSSAWTTFLTVLAGVLVFVGGQVVQRFVLEPIQEQRRLIGDVAHALDYYDDAYLDDALLQNLDEEWLNRHREYVREARKPIHDLGGRLQASLWTIPFYDLFGYLHLVPKRQNVLDASAELRGWSKGLEGGDAGIRAAGRRKTIREKLDIEQD